MGKLLTALCENWENADGNVDSAQAVWILKHANLAEWDLGRCLMQPKSVFTRLESQKPLLLKKLLGSHAASD